MREVYSDPFSYYEEVEKSDRMIKWEASQSKRYFEYRKKWSENSRKGIVEDFPLQLDLEITNICNLRCKMCAITAKENMGIKEKRGFMDWNLFKKILDEGGENCLYAMNLNGFGEPLLNPFLPKMISYAKERGVIDTMFHTNATLLTEEKAKKIIESGLDKIIFSFDSPVKETYENIRVGAKFEDTYSNIINFVRIRDELGSITPLVRITMIKMKENQKEINLFIKMWKSIADVITFQEYMNQYQLYPDEKGTYTRVIHPNFVCPQIYQRLFITWDGIVLPCCVETNREYILGDANKDSLKSIWHGDKLSKLRELHKRGEWNKIKICSKCDLPYI